MENGNQKHFDVFISYRRDKGFGIARSIYAELVFRGYRVFMDTEHLGSGEFREKLLRQIRKAKDVIFVLTEGALDIRKDTNPSEDWLRLEIDAALPSRPNGKPLPHKRPNILPIKDSRFKWPSDDVLKARGVAGGIDVLQFRGWEAETFDPTHFSNLIDLLTGENRRKDFRLCAKPIVKYWHRIKITAMTALLALGLSWGSVSQIRGLGKLFGVRHDPIVLIGSGTVSNYLRQKGVEEKDRDVIIIDAPSNYGLKLLREAKNSERGHCYVMFMAAQWLDGDEFKENAPDAARLSVVEVGLPSSDRLQVVLKPYSAFSGYLPPGSTSIRIDQLVDILESFQTRGDTFIYRTSLDSGTFKLFKEEFRKSGYELAGHENVREFYESDTGDTLHMTTDEKVIVLCGALYKPADGEFNCLGREGKLLDVVDAQGRELKKPMNLYFVVSKDNPVIPKAIKAFLPLIGKSGVLDNLTTSHLDETGIYRDDGKDE